MKKKEIQFFETFEAADRADREYYRNLSGADRLELALKLMAPYYAAYPRFERIYRVVELSKSPIRDSWGMGV